MKWLLPAANPIIDQYLNNEHTSEESLTPLFQNWAYSSNSIFLLQEIMRSAKKAKVQVTGIDKTGSLSERNDAWAKRIQNHHKERSLVFCGCAHIGEVNSNLAEWECEAEPIGIEKRLKDQKIIVDWLAVAKPFDTQSTIPVFPRSRDGIEIQNKIIFLPQRLDKIVQDFTFEKTKLLNAAIDDEIQKNSSQHVLINRRF